MSTRALYSIFDENQEPINIYIHSDGYPTGAASRIQDALKFAWTLPRFEADEFAAALCAGVKTHYMVQLIDALERQVKGEKLANEWRTSEKIREYMKHLTGGGARVFPAGDPKTVGAAHCSDIEFRYEIRSLDGKLFVKCLSTNYWSSAEETELFSGEFKNFTAWAKREEKKARAA